VTLVSAVPAMPAMTALTALTRFLHPRTSADAIVFGQDEPRRDIR
jgi:hypothetical protein